MKVLAPAILVFEALLVALAIPVALNQGRGATTGWLLAGLAVVLVVAAGASRRPGGVRIGWAMQVLVLLSSIVEPAMAVVGLVFLGVWVTAVIYGGKADRAVAARAAVVAEPSSSATAPPEND
ncbi:MAG: DUF4233 domain-containing protein [Actinomycetes bacterium]|jgi:hypothetical protein